MLIAYAKQALAEYLMQADILALPGVTLWDAQEVIRTQMRPKFPDFTVTLVRLDNEVRSGSVRYRNELPERVRLMQVKGAWNWDDRPGLMPTTEFGLLFTPTKEKLRELKAAFAASGAQRMPWLKVKQQLVH